ncbi:hypothetical protein, partial [Corynebacterium anserum]
RSTSHHSTGPPFARNVPPTHTGLVCGVFLRDPRFNIQSFCQHDDIDQSDIALSVLDRADVRAVALATACWTIPLETPNSAAASSTVGY